ncbi:MAG TPA: phosphatase PAP2 family protein [Nocardioides sp.]|uniref:phosphatase PAP2 family protein n=1 Tax=Nocardioides sp. TaxID=35761 RepID=UPI002E32C7E9|nr:phosphatase PAP2 family protein [Nocardioides sp.]HEX5088420.1 phosphatase PAP2 family protein [Nocardioides sp.]
MLLPRQVLLRHRRARWILGQVALMTAAIFCYFQVRGLTAGNPDLATEHAHRLVEIEKALGIDVEAAVQAPVASSVGLETVANWVYIWGHWPVIVATMVWLVLRHRWAFLRLRDAMLVSGGLGLVVFVTYPVAPPRLADPTLVDTVTQHSYSYRVLQPPNFVNQYAALPSLHAGWDLLVGIALATAGGTLLIRSAGWVMPPLMAFAVIATANHYVLDVAAGLALALVGYAAALLLERRRAARAPRVSRRPDAPASHGSHRHDLVGHRTPGR